MSGGREGRGTRECRNLERTLLYPVTRAHTHTHTHTCTRTHTHTHTHAHAHTRTHTHSLTHTHTTGYHNLALEYFDFFKAYVPLDTDHHGNVEVVFELLAAEDQLVEALQVCRGYEGSEVEERYYEVLLEACRNSKWRGQLIAC